jgi:predicted nucleic acid-binding protein
MTPHPEIPEGSCVLIDTNPLIYLFEASPLLAPFEWVFAAIDAGKIQAVVTPITLSEVVTGPLRHHKEALAERYRKLLTANRGWIFCDLDAESAMLAARLRIQYRLKLPDAFQLASAIRQGCTALVTHDRDFSLVEDLLIVGG